jgi:CHAT domain-containing protein/tetratricopeptide (TPR) repeat protein
MLAISGFFLSWTSAHADQPTTAIPRELSRADADWVARKHADAVVLGRAGKWGPDQAQKPIREIVELCERRLGKDHYLPATYRRELAILQKLTTLPEADRLEYVKTYALYDSMDELRKQYRYAEAQAPAEKILEIYRRLLGAESELVAMMANEYGKLLYHNDRYADSEKQLALALRIYRSVLGETDPVMAEIHGYLGLVLERLGRLADSRRHHEKALMLATQLRGPDHFVTVVTANNLASYLDRQGHYQEAEDLFRKGIKSLKAQQPLTNVLLATAYNNFALTLQHQGKYDEAENCFQDALALRRRLKEDPSSTARVYMNLASNREAQGNYAAAEHFYRQALDTYVKSYGLKSAETAWAMNNLGVNLDKQGKFVEGETRLREALAIVEQAPGDQSRAIAKMTNNLASCLRGQEKNADNEAMCTRALALLRKQLEPDHPDIAVVLNNLASAQFDQDRYAEAEAHFREALDITEKRLGKDHPDTAFGRVNLAVDLYHLGKYAAAEPFLQAALESMQKVLGEGHPNTAWTYKNLVGNRCARGDYAGALALSGPASRSFEAARVRLGFAGLDRARRAADISPMPNLAVAAARCNQPLAAWQALESNLARGLLDDLIASRLSAADRNRVQTLFEKLTSLDQQISDSSAADPKKDRTIVQKERDALQAELVAALASPDVKYGVVEGPVFDLARIQRQLADDAALLTWVDLPKATGANARGDHWACLVRRNGDPGWVQLTGSGPDGAWTDEDDRRAIQARRALERRPVDGGKQWKELADNLGRQRLAPLEKLLQAQNGQAAIKHLIVLPASKMAAVPIEALVDRYTVSYAPSGTLYAALRERQARQANSTATLLALGDPAFALARDAATADKNQLTARTEAFVRLPGTRQELMGVARVFSETRLLMGDQASARNLDALAADNSLSHFRYLHFATHGVLDDQHPLRSALILAEDKDAAKNKPQDANGRLTAEHILRGWKLNADLVTFSACNTGMGKLSGGEGYLGFSQSLFVAGARSLVLSLWPVDDAATALLMTRFYENLLGTPEGNVKPMHRGEALAEAKRWLRTLGPDDVQKLTKDLPVRGTRGRIESRRGAAANGIRSYEHPYFWSGFILIGDPT